MLCVWILLRERLGLFWDVFDDLILLFMYSPPHEREPRSQVVSVFFSLTHFPSLSCKHTQLHIYLAICYHFQEYPSSFSALFFCFICRDLYTSNLPLSESSRCSKFQCNLTSLCVCVQFIVFACACTCLMKAPAVFVPLHSPIWSIASWVCQRGSCHEISPNPISQPCTNPN